MEKKIETAVEKKVEKNIVKKQEPELERTILICAAGPGLGLSVAKRFGREGFNVALIARNPEKMDFMLSELRGMGITAEGFLCDYLDEEALDKALDAAIERFGFIDTVEFQMDSLKTMKTGDALASRALRATKGMGAIDLDPYDIVREVEARIVPLVQVVNKLLPHMQLHRQNYISGFIYTMGWSGVWPTEEDGVDIPYHIMRKSPVSIAYSAIIKYLKFLNAQMCYDNIYAVANNIGVWIKPGTPHDPDLIADGLYNNAYLARQNDAMKRRQVIEVWPPDLKCARDLVRY